MLGYFVDVSTGSGLHSSAFCGDLCLLLREVPLMRSEALLICGCKDKCLYIVLVDHDGFKTSACRFSFKNPDVINISSYVGF